LISRRGHGRRRFAIAGAASVLAWALTACGGGASVPAQRPAPPQTPTPTHLGAFTSPPWTFSTSSYWIEGPTGLILIDSQFTPSEAEKFLAKAEAETHKKAVLAIILHANPDKFNGTGVFQKRGIKVVTSSQVRALIPEVFKIRTAAFGERYAPDWPTETPMPESFGSESTTLEAGGVNVRAHVMGAGCGEAHVVVEWEKSVFVGDLVAQANHSWLEIGKTDEWLERLKEIDALKPRLVHPGRGTPGGPELISKEMKYLNDVIRMVGEERPTMPIPAGALDRVATKIVALYPDYGFAVFLNIGLPAEWQRQAKLTRKT